MTAAAVHRDTGENVPIWRMTAPAGPRLHPLDRDRSSDIVIIGGGFSGLSAALHLAGNNADVTVLEAAELGAGASGRTNGQVIPMMKKEDPQALLKHYGPEHGPRVLAAIRDSAALVFELIERHGIACEAEQRGWVQPALTRGQLEIVKRRAESWARHGANVELLDRQQTAAVLGSDFYMGSLRANDGGAIQPLAYARGLALAAIDRGAQIYQHSRATDIERLTDGWRVSTGDYAIKARRLILATAVYTGRLAPGLARHILPASFYQLATRPLSDSAAAGILPGCAAMSDLQGDIHFFRKDAAGRLITGGTFIFKHRWEQRLAPLVERRLARVFPQIKHFETETQWSGEVAMTRDAFPRIGELQPGFFGWVGCNSRGIALSTLIGVQLAKLALAIPPREQPFPLELTPAISLRPLANLGIATVLLGARARDRLDHWRAGKG